MSNWYECPFVSFDTETTGIDAETARIVTAAVVFVDPARGSTEVCEWLSDVDGAEIPAEAAKIHGVTTEYARKLGLPASEVVAEIAMALDAAWEAGKPVVVYNAPYDLTLLDRELYRHHNERPSPVGPVIDPLVLDKHYDQFRRGSRKLAVAAKHYGIELSEDDAHGATADALAAARVAWRMARVFPELAAMQLSELHSKQIEWHAEQAASLQEFFRRKGSDEVVPLDWPVRPVAEEVAA